MADEVRLKEELPLVEKVESVSPGENPPMVSLVVKKAHPGFFEAILWCLIFLGTQLVSLLLISILVFLVFVLKAKEPQEFVRNQMDQIAKAAEKNEASDQAASFPIELGQSLAYGMLGAQFASLGLILLVLPLRIGKGWRRQIGLRRPELLQVLIIILLVPGFLFLTSGIEELLKESAGLTLPTIGKGLNDTFNSFPWFLTFLAVGLGPGVVEEIWCRGFLGRGLSARYGLIAGISMTSIMFGLLHCSLTYAIPTAIMGAYLHFVYLACRSIWISILLHMLNNTIAVFLTISTVGEQLDAAFQRESYAIYFTSFALVLFASIALWMCRPRIVPSDILGVEVGEASSWKPEYPGILAPPPDSGFRFQSGTTSLAALGLTLVSFAILALLLTCG